MATRDTEENTGPCWFMRDAVSRMADGTLRGIARWYAELHVPRCPRCRQALQALRDLLHRLRHLDEGPAANTPETLAPARWQEVEAAWQSIDARSEADEIRPG